MRYLIRITMLLLVAGFVFVLPACNRGHSRNVRLQREWNARCKETADLLTGVTDEASAQAAAPKIKAAMKDLERINRKLDESYDPEDVAGREANEMAEELGKGIGDFQRMMTESFRISQKPELVAALGDAWESLPTSMMLEANGMGPKRKR